MWAKEETESNIIGVIAGICEHEARSNFGGEETSQNPDKSLSLKVMNEQ